MFGFRRARPQRRRPQALNYIRRSPAAASACVWLSVCTLEAAHGAPGTPVGRRLMGFSGTRDRSCASQHLAKLRLVWERRGRDVVVESAGLGLREMRIGYRRDDKPAIVGATSGDFDLVTHVYLTMGLATVTVDRDLASVAGALGLGTCLEHAGDVKPHIQTDHRRNSELVECSHDS